MAACSWAALMLAGTCAQAATLCEKGEEVVFSCPMAGGKIVSLCGGPAHDGSAGEPAADAWLQYRFGRPQHVELVYPARRAGSLARFDGEHRAGAGVRLDVIAFTNHGATYQIEDSASSLTGESFSGLRVTATKSAKPVELSCQSINDIGSRFADLAEQLDPSGKQPR